MTSPSLAARPLALLGYALAIAAALSLAACGSDGAATAEDAGTPRGRSDHKAEALAGAHPASADPCPAKLDTFVDLLHHLRRQLAVGLSYQQYAARVKALRAGYDQIPIDRLTISCLNSVGTPSEDALNRYIDAANAWGQCLADAACTTASIEPVLQRKWRIASHFLSAAQ
jgi:hypothetical protein